MTTGIEWKPLDVPVPDRVNASIASINLPVYPEAPSDAQSFSFSVSRMVRGARPNVHMIMLAGGPGQKGTLYLKSANNIAKKFSGDFALYLPSHRGTGKSGKIAKSDRATLNEIEPDALPLDSITVQNAAWDVISLAKQIMAGPDWETGHRLALYGCSYGGLWATRAINLEPDLFYSALLNSPLVIENYWDPANDRELLKSCQDNEFCRKQLGGNAGNIRNVLSHLGNPNLNGCTKMILQELERMVEYTMIKGHPEASKNENLIASFIGNMAKQSAKSAMKSVALLNHLYTCPNPEEFRKLLPSILSSADGPKTPESMLESFGEDNVMALENFGGGASMNSIVNIFVLGHELYALPDGPTPDVCRGKIPLGMTNFCNSYWSYKQHWKNHFINHTPPVSPIRADPIKTSKTRIIVFQGALDTSTPLPSVEQFFNKCTAKSKRLIVQKNAGHSGLFSSKCAQFILNEAMIGSSPLATNMCIMWANRTEPVDWSFSKDPSLSALWLRDPKSAKALPASHDSNVSGNPPSHLIASTWQKNQSMDIAWNITSVCAFVFGIIIALAVAIIWNRRQKSRKQQK